MNCKRCGGPVTKKPGPGRWPHYCSVECRNPRRRVAPSKPKPARFQGVCEHCGSSCRSANGRGKVRFCNAPECRRAGQRIREQEKYVPVQHFCVCVICSQEFVSRRAGTKFCGRVCAAKQQTLKRRETGQASRYNYTKKLTCERCNVEFFGKLRQRFCGVACSNAFAREVAVVACVDAARLRKKDRQQVVLFTGENAAPEAPVTILRGSWWCAGNCAVCGAPFVSPHSDKTCSAFCRKAFYRRKKQQIPLGKKARLAVYERDSFVCQICMEPTDPLADPVSNWFPSLDHIIPRSKGGDDSLENLRTAHRWCNSVLSDGQYYTDLDLRVA